MGKGVQKFGKKVGEIFGIGWEVVAMCVCVGVFLILIDVFVRSE